MYLKVHRWSHTIHKSPHVKCITGGVGVYYGGVVHLCLFVHLKNCTFLYICNFLYICTFEHLYICTFEHLFIAN